MTNRQPLDKITDNGKGYEKEEYAGRTKREDGSPAERRSGEAAAEGSF